jgi:uroporphyrin-III C-methyltransferase / precorrin-2 dehydrogenase / sirohydrochlorin ferrochelatase
MGATLTPIEQSERSSCMQPLAQLPIFLSLAGKRAVVVGGTAAAAWKAELLSAAGADVEVYAAEACDELEALTAQPSPGTVSVHPRQLERADLNDAALLVASCKDDGAAAALVALARDARVPVNVIDRPEFCDFSFGAIVNRSPLVIGISTDGAAPVFAQTIRAKLEAMIPLAFAHWADVARRFRPQVQALGLSFRSRRRFWERFAGEAAMRPSRVPSDSELAAWLGESRASGDRGSLILVDAGLDAADMLPLRAVRALQSADAIVADADVPSAVLDFARREARRLVLGTSPSDAPAQADARTIALARQGRHVVRLAVGATFPPAAMVEMCGRERIAIEVVPSARRATSYPDAIDAGEPEQRMKALK